MEQGAVFLEPIQWMGDQVVGPVQGKLYCPHCNARLGSFNWSGGSYCLLFPVAFVDNILACILFGGTKPNQMLVPCTARLMSADSGIVAAIRVPPPGNIHAGISTTAALLHPQAHLF
jgi:hypothetical protein